MGIYLRDIMMPIKAMYRFGRYVSCTVVWGSLDKQSLKISLYAVYVEYIKIF